MTKATRITSEARKLMSMGLDREAAISAAISSIPATPADKAFARKMWDATATLAAAIEPGDYQAECRARTSAFDAAQRERTERAMVA